MIESMNMPEADEIAARRPPDRVEYGPWEPDPESEVVVVRHVPVEGSLLRGFTYEERRHTEYRAERRGVLEFWDEPARVVFDIDQPFTIGLDGNVTNIEWRTRPARTVGRRHFEYRSIR